MDELAHLNYSSRVLGSREGDGWGRQKGKQRQRVGGINQLIGSPAVFKQKGQVGYIWQKAGWQLGRGALPGSPRPGKKLQ